MSDNDDLLADDLGDQNLGDYTLGNDEEDQLLADDYESVSQNVPISVGPQYDAPQEYSAPIEYNEPTQYHMDTECVVPNITVEVPNPRPPTYAPYEPPAYEPESVVPPAVPSVPLESPQIVPTDFSASLSNGDNGRERFISERPPGAQRTPQVRDIPDSLDKVLVPRGGYVNRPRTSWHNPHYNPRQSHPYRRNNVQRGNFNQRPSFPPPQMRHSPPQIRPEFRPERPGFRPDVPEFRPNRPEFRPEGPQFRPDGPQFRPDDPQFRPDGPQFRPDGPQFRPDGPQFGPDRPDFRPETRPDFQPDRPSFRQERPEFNPDRPEFNPNLPRPEERPIQEMPFRPPMEIRPFNPNFPPRFPNQFRPNLEDPRFKDPGFRPRFDNQFQYRPGFNPRFQPPVREIASNSNHLPQVTIRQPLPNPMPKPGQREPEVRMLPVQLPPNLPGGLQGKKVLINPHFKGNFQPPTDGPVKDIDDAAERFIAEQRNALARAATRKIRYIENTTIEIDNELSRKTEEDDLLRRQEEFINANRAGLRRRMRTPSPPRRSPSPRRRLDARLATDEDSEYKRRVREQESLRERVLRAKEVRRRKNAVALQKQIQDKDRERLEKSENKQIPDTSNIEPARPDTTRHSPDKIPEKNTKKDDKRSEERVGSMGEKVGSLGAKVGSLGGKVASDDKVKRDRSPLRKEEAVVNSTCETLTPPRPSCERALTPPLPAGARTDSDDELDLILDDIDDILSDDDDTGRFKERGKKPEPPKAKPPVDLRSKLPPKSQEKKPPRQKIVFSEPKEEKKKEKTPPKKSTVTSTKTEVVKEEKSMKTKQKAESAASKLSKSRITFDNKEPDKEKEKDPKPFTNRRVILQRKVTDNSVFSRIEVKSDPTKPNAGIFSRAVRTAIGNDKRIVIQKEEKEPKIEYESDSDIDEDKLLEEDIGFVALVKNLPHGMTDTRLKTLAGSCQSLTLDKEERVARITFKTTIAAESFKKKFNNKMVAASRLSVSLL